MYLYFFLWSVLFPWLATMWMLLNLLPQHRSNHKVDGIGKNGEGICSKSQLISTEPTLDRTVWLDGWLDAWKAHKVKSITKNPREFRQSVSLSDKQCTATYPGLPFCPPTSCLFLPLLPWLARLLLMLWPQMPEIYANICIQCPKINRKMVAVWRARGSDGSGTGLLELGGEGGCRTEEDCLPAKWCCLLLCAGCLGCAENFIFMAASRECWYLCIECNNSIAHLRKRRSGESEVLAEPAWWLLVLLVSS